MGIYSNSYVGQPSDYGYDETLNSIMLDNNIEPCKSDDLIAESYDIMYTMEENYNMLFMTLGINELRSIEEEEQRFVYTEGVFQTIFNFIKKYIKKIWDKIKSLFKRFMLLWDSYTKTDKEFINKYRRQIFTYKKLDDFEFKGYKWNIKEKDIEKIMIEIGRNAESCYDHLDEENFRASWHRGDFVQKLKDEWEKESGKMRGEIFRLLGESDKSRTLSEYREDLKLYFRSGDLEKQLLDKSDLNISEMCKYLTESASSNKKIQKSFKSSKKLIEEVEKMVEDERKFSEKMSKSTDTTLGKKAMGAHGVALVWRGGRRQNDPHEFTYKKVWNAGKVMLDRQMRDGLDVDNDPRLQRLTTDANPENVRGWLHDNQSTWLIINYTPAFMKHVKSGNYLEVNAENIPKMSDRQLMWIWKYCIKQMTIPNMTGIKNPKYDPTYDYTHSSYDKIHDTDGYDVNKDPDQKGLPEINGMETRTFKNSPRGSELYVGPNTKFNPDKIKDPDDFYEVGSDSILRTDQGDATEAEYHQYRLKRIQVLPQYTTFCLQLLTATNGEILDATKTCSRQYKACLVKYITYKPKKEDTEFLTEESDLIYDNEKPLYREPFNNFNHVENIRIV